ncbi:MAG: hypothetical protein ACRDQC_02310 [Gaiellales bacterium]
MSARRFLSPRYVRRRLRCMRVGHKWVYHRPSLESDERLRRCLRCSRWEHVRDRPSPARDASSQPAR